MWSRAAACALLVAGGTTLRGQDVDVRFAVADRRFGIREGLPGLQVLGVAETRDGSVWAGTISGLARLGGSAVRVWTSGDGLPASAVYVIHETAAGDLLAGTLRGVARLEGGRFVPEPGPPGLQGRVRALLALPGDEVVALVDARGLFLRRGRSWSELAVAGAPSFRATSAAVDARGDLWLATRESGLLHFALDAARGRAELREQRSAPAFPGGLASAVIRDGDGVAATARDALWRIGPQGEQRIASGLALQFATLARTPDGRLFAATDEAGVLEVLPGGLRLLHSRDGLARAAPVRMAADAAGNLWVGTVDRGLVALLTGSRLRYLMVDGADASGIGLDPEGGVWVCSERALVRFRLDAQGDPAGARRVPAPPELARFYAILEDAEGALVLSTSGGVARVPRWRDPAATVLEKDPRFPGDALVHLERGPDGALWARSTDGLFVHHPGAPRAEAVPLPGVSAARELAVDAAGVVWLDDRSASLWRLAPGRAPERVPTGSARVHHVISDPDGHVIVRMEDGAWSRFESGSGRLRVQHPGSGPLGVLSPLALVPLGSGQFLAGIAGSLVARVTLEPPRLLEATLSAVEMDEADFRFLTMRAAGERDVWLATLGQVAHQPRGVPLPPPRPLLVEARAEEGAPALDPAHPRLPPRPNALVAHLALADPLSRRVRYRWRLVGESEQWSRWSGDATVRLANLGPGDFVLEVEARDRWGRPAANGRVSLPLSAAPLLYETWPFRAAAALLLMAAGVLVYRVRVRALVRDKERLEQAVAARSADLAARNAELREANARLEDLQAQIERFSARGREAVDDVQHWAQAMAGEVARAIGAEAVEVFEAGAGELNPLSTVSSPAPTVPDLGQALASGGFLAGGEQGLVAAKGITGETFGAVRVRGKASWSEAERRVLASFAHQLGGALELRRMRETLQAAEARRAAGRRELIESGLELVRVCPRCGRVAPSEAAACPGDGATLDDATLLPRDVAGRYRLQRVLGSGGMGTVLGAHDLRLEREVAVKILREDRFATSGARLRLQKEARLAAGLDHPSVVAVHDSGDLPDGSSFIVMESLRGVDLERVLRRHGPGAPAQVAQILRQGAPGLAAAHAHGLVHRDIKSANIFLAAAGAGFRVKILDFGIAKSVLEGDTGLTQTGAVLGTPSYMSPEQALGQAVDARTDVYSFGVVAFEALTGERPFAEPQLPDLLHAIVYDPPPPPSALRPGLTPAVDAAFAAVLAKRPEERPRGLEAWAVSLAAELERLPGAGWPAEALLGGEEPPDALLRDAATR